MISPKISLSFSMILEMIVLPQCQSWLLLCIKPFTSTPARSLLKYYLHQNKPVITLFYQYRYFFSKVTKANIEAWNIRRVCYSFQNFLSQINSSCPLLTMIHSRYCYILRFTMFHKKINLSLVSESICLLPPRAGIRSSSINEWNFCLILPYISKSSAGSPVWLLFQLLVWCWLSEQFQYLFSSMRRYFNLKNHFFNP